MIEEWSNQPKANHSADDGPSISVIIPCKPSDGLPPVIESASKLDYPSDLFEILLIKGTNPSLQRNLGASLAKGDILAFTDDNCQLPPDWLRLAAKHFRDARVSIVGGPNLTPPSDPRLSRIFGLACASKLGTGPMHRRYRRTRLLPQADESALALSNLFIRRKLFDSGLSFSPLLFPNEENQFMNGASRQGHRMVYDPDIVVYHPRKRSWRAFSRQFARYGAGRARQTRMDLGSLRPFHLLPGALVLASMFLLVGVLLFRRLLPWVLLLAAAYIVPIVAESVRISLREGDPKAAWLLIPSFLLIHYSYGFGFVMGLICPLGKIRGAAPTRDDVSRLEPSGYTWPAGQRIS